MNLNLIIISLRLIQTNIPQNNAKDDSNKENNEASSASLNRITDTYDNEVTVENCSNKVDLADNESSNYADKEEEEEEEEVLRAETRLD